MSDDRVNELDKAISTGSSSDPEVESLARLGDELKEEYAADVRPNPGVKALFVSAAAARGGRAHRPAVLAPIAAGLALLLVLVAFLSRGADPGQALYPVRDALDNLGLANKPVEFVDGHINTADRLIERAEDALSDDQYARAQGLAIDALVYLDDARGSLDELSGEQREERADDIADLEEDAHEVLNDAAEERIEAAGGDDDSDEDGSGPGSGDDDSSGPGSGDDDPDDDSSGPGSGGDDRDDSSGPGSGDDDPEDDSSGPGSGDDDRDDSSGPGSGDESSGSGSSGSGSGSSGSGSSGSGSSGSGSDD